MPQINRRWMHRWGCGWLAACALLLLDLPSATRASAQPPAEALAETLLDSPAYDVLILKENATALRLAPLDLQPRQPVPRGADEELLIVRLEERPSQQYQVAWAAIERVQLFEELLLKAAAEEARHDRFDSAWACLERVRASNAEFAGLADAELAVLYLEAGAWHQQGQSDRALGLLHEIHRRAAEYPRLAEAYGAVVDRLVQADLQSENLLAVRGLLGELAERFPQHPVLQSYEGLLATRAADAVTAAETAIAGGQWRAAWAAAREALAWRPSDPAALALQRRLAAEYPVVRAGVAHAYTTDATQSWAAERASWLLYRRWCEPLGGTPAPLGVGPGLATVEQQDSVLHLRLSSVGRPAQAELYRWLLAPPVEWQPAWQTLVTSCEVAGQDEFLLHLRGPIEEFVSLLTLPLRGGGPAALPLAGEYAEHESLGEEDIYRYSGLDSRPLGQAAEIVERRLAPGDMSRALQRGEVDLLDRVPLQELARVRALPGVRLAAYTRPTRLLLVFSPRFTGGTTATLRRLLAAGARLGRPALADADWGADAPRPSYFCLTDRAPQTPEDELTERDVARLWSLQQQAPAGQGTTAPTVRLAYCASSNAEAIAQRLGETWAAQLPGLAVQLTQLSGDGWPGRDELTWDACCVEFRAQDARLDAWRLFGADGLVGRTGPELPLLCRAAVAAQSAGEFAAAVAELERLAREHGACVPLVEWTDYAAIPQSVAVPPDPFVSLYQRIADWRHSAEDVP